MWINKAVVGSSRRDAPKYTGRVWHLTDHPVIQVVPARGFVAIFRQFHVDTPHPKYVFLCSDVTSSGGTVTSCVMSQCCMCTGHMTFCYKRSANASFEALLARLALGALSSWPFVRQAHPGHPCMADV